MIPLLIECNSKVEVILKINELNSHWQSLVNWLSHPYAKQHCKTVSNVFIHNQKKCGTLSNFIILIN